MIKKVLVKKIIQRTEFYAPRIVANDDTFAAIPKELLDEIQINDEVMVFSSDYLSYGGFSALVIKTPTKTLYDKWNRNSIWENGGTIWKINTILEIK